jgi:hypothetical protein
MLLFFAKGEELRNLKFIMVMELFAPVVNQGGTVSHKYKGKISSKNCRYHDQWKKTETMQSNGFFWHLKFTNYNNYWQ